MRENDIPFGVYNFTYAVTAEEAERDARMFWDVAHEYDPLFYVLDAEEKGITQDVIKTWVQTIRECGAKKVGAYVGHSRYDDYGFDDLRHLFDFVWIPRYGKDDGTLEGSKKPKYACDLWQYTSEGRIDGIERHVDLNIITGQGHDLEWF